MRRRRNRFLSKFFIFFMLFLSLSVMGFTYANWHSSLFVETKLTSGVMDVLFPKQKEEKYSVFITDIDGNDPVLLEAEFNVKDKEMEISFNEGLPINQLTEGKLLKLEFPVSPSSESTVTSLNYTKFDPLNIGEDLELKAQKALLVKEGTGYFLGDNEALFTEPLKFELYKALSDNKENAGGQIYLRLQEESVEKIKALPTDLKINSEDLIEYTDLDLKERNLISTIGNGVVVTYSLEIPFEVEQSIPKKYISRERE